MLTFDIKIEYIYLTQTLTWNKNSNDKFNKGKLVKVTQYQHGNVLYFFSRLRCKFSSPFFPFQLQGNNTRFGLIQFSKKSDLTVPLAHYQNWTQLVEKVSRMEKYHWNGHGKTNTASALRMALDTLNSSEANEYKYEMSKKNV